ncbi:uncharacterized protein LOC134823090 [Bolinopsis microptera]|uniref:uncharacterized protein LOC134823090 n=1 Tax=Bolinopsis microptera TaxID=2820187 RepID=UPI003078CD9E
MTTAGHHLSLTTIILPRAQPPIREADLVLGSILLVCSILGIPANCAACYHFCTQITKNKNSSFFKQIYTIISFIDVMIGIAQLPIAQTLLLGRDSPDLLFRGAPFCYSWYIIWLLIKQGAVFMVAFLSISRLTILMTTSKVMSLRNSWLIPSLFAGFVLIVLGILPLATDYAVVQYAPDNAMCRITVDDPSQTPIYITPISMTTLTTPTATDWRPYFRQSFVVTITEACFLGLPVFPIFISLVLSLQFLKKADARSLRITSGHERTTRDNKENKENKRQNKPVTKHKEASVTILMVTLVYVIFNIPALCMTVYLAYIYCTCLTLLHASNYSEQLLFKYASRVYTTFGPAWQYTWLVVYGVSQVLNSTVNPVLYWWRMKHFRQFLSRGRLSVSETSRSFTSSFRSLVTNNFQVRPGLRGDSKYHAVNEEKI